MKGDRTGRVLDEEGSMCRDHGVSEPGKFEEL